MEQFFHVGTITSPHGVRGDLKVYPTTDDPERFLDLEKVILRKKAGGSGEETRKVSNVRFLKNMVILHLEGIPDRNTAELYRQCELYVPREEAVPLDEDEYYALISGSQKSCPYYRKDDEYGIVRKQM